MGWSKSVILSLLLIWHIVYPKTVCVLNWNSDIKAGTSEYSTTSWCQLHEPYKTKIFFFSHVSSGKGMVPYTSWTWKIVKEVYFTLR